MSRSRRRRDGCARRCLQRLRFSLSARLMALFLLTALVLALLFGATVSIATRYYFTRVLGPHAAQYLDYLAQDIGDPPDIDRARELARQLPVEIVLRGPDVNWSSTPDPPAVENARFRSGEELDPHRRWALPPDRMRQFAVSSDGDRFILRTRLDVHQLYLSVERRGRRQGTWWGLLVSVVAVALMLTVLYLCYRAIRRLFQPVQTIRLGVGRIGAGDFEHRIALPRRDELGELAGSINAMADEIEKMLDAKRQLLLAISHELRSPLTRARVSAELLNDSRERDAIIDDLQEMEQLIGDMLEGERLGDRHRALQLQPVDLAALARQLVDEYAVSTDAGRATDQARTPLLTLPPALPPALLDPGRIRLLLKNLLDNALRHTPAQALPPRLSIGREPDPGSGDNLCIRVVDHGAGVAAEHLPHLAEPFYRADRSRQRQTGGYGLGLYLCRLVAQAHGGRLTIRSRAAAETLAGDPNGTGTTVTVTLPLRHPV